MPNPSTPLIERKPSEYRTPINSSSQEDDSSFLPSRIYLKNSNASDRTIAVSYKKGNTGGTNIGSEHDITLDLDISTPTQSSSRRQTTDSNDSNSPPGSYNDVSQPDTPSVKEYSWYLFDKVKACYNHNSPTWRLMKQRLVPFVLILAVSRATDIVIYQHITESVQQFSWFFSAVCYPFLVLVLTVPVILYRIVTAKIEPSILVHAKTSHFQKSVLVVAILQVLYSICSSLSVPFLHAGQICMMNVLMLPFSMAISAMRGLGNFAAVHYLAVTLIMLGVLVKSSPILNDMEANSSSSLFIVLVYLIGVVFLAASYVKMEFLLKEKIPRNKEDYTTLTMLEKQNDHPEVDLWLFYANNMLWQFIFGIISLLFFTMNLPCDVMQLQALTITSLPLYATNATRCIFERSPDIAAIQPLSNICPDSIISKQSDNVTVYCNESLLWSWTEVSNGTLDKQLDVFRDVYKLSESQATLYSLFFLIVYFVVNTMWNLLMLMMFRTGSAVLFVISTVIALPVVDLFSSFIELIIVDTSPLSLVVPASFSIYDLLSILIILIGLLVYISAVGHTSVTQDAGWLYNGFSRMIDDVTADEMLLSKEYLISKKNVFVLRKVDSASGGSGAQYFECVIKGRIRAFLKKFDTEMLHDTSRKGTKWSELKMEMTIMSQLHHRNVLRIIGYCRPEKSIYVMFPMMDAQTLWNLIYEGGEDLSLQPIRKRTKLDHVLFSKNKANSDNPLRRACRRLLCDPMFEIPSQPQRFPPELTCVIALEVAKGLDYLHLMNVAHNDIKPSNILLNTFGEIKISDFGLSRVFRGASKVVHQSGPMPRTISNKIPYHRAEGGGTQRPASSISSPVTSFLNTAASHREDTVLKINKDTTFAQSEKRRKDAFLRRFVFSKPKIPKGTLQYIAPEVLSQKSGSCVVGKSPFGARLKKHIHSSSSDKDMASFLCDLRDVLEEDTRNGSPSLFWEEKADIYSFGIMLWELTFRAVPYGTEGGDASWFYNKVVLMDERPRIPNQWGLDTILDDILEPSSGSSSSSKVGKDGEHWKKIMIILQTCWQRHPLSRPSANSLTQLFRKVKD
eukprot:g1919.t1